MWHKLSSSFYICIFFLKKMFNREESNALLYMEEFQLSKDSLRMPYYLHTSIAQTTTNLRICRFLMCKSVIFCFIWYVPNSTYVATGRHISTSQSFLGVVIEHLANLLHIHYMHGLKLALLPWHQSGLEHAPSVQSVLILMKKPLSIHSFGTLFVLNMYSEWWAH